MTVEAFDLALYGFLVEKGNIEELRSFRGARLTSFLNHLYNENIKHHQKEKDLVKFFRLPGEPQSTLSEQIETEDHFVEDI